MTDTQTQFNPGDQVKLIKGRTVFTLRQVRDDPDAPDQVWVMQAPNGKMRTALVSDLQRILNASSSRPGER